MILFIQIDHDLQQNATDENYLDINIIAADEGLHRND